MPDFDPKTIPTLDDVIETVTPEVSDSEISDHEVDPIIVVESEPVLFTTEPVVDFTDELDIEDTELEPEVLPDTSIESSFDFVEDDDEAELNQIDTSPDLTDEEDSENLESALLDYNEDPISDTDTELVTDEFQPDEPSVSVTVQSPTLISDTELQSISDEIVLQLMPELEQRLRVLVQQVLKEKLPPEIVQFDTDSSTNIDD